MNTMRTIHTILILSLLSAVLVPNSALAQPPKEVVDHFKAIFFCKKKADLSDEAFKSWVLDTHVPMVKSMPGVKGYVQNFVLEKPDGFPYDLVVELWFDNEADYAAAYDSEAGKMAVADVPNGLSEFPVSIPVYEVPIRDAPMPEEVHQSKFKGMWVANHNPELDYRDYQLGQLMTYSPLAKRFPGMEGYTLNFNRTPEDPEKVYSLVVNTWFDSQEAMMRSFSSRSDMMSRLKEKQKVLLENQAVMIPVQEYVLVRPPSYQGDLTE